MAAFGGNGGWVRSAFRTALPCGFPCALVAWALPALAITTTPTKTPVLQQIAGVVLIPAKTGLIGAGGVGVEVLPCGSSLCLHGPAVVTVVTAADGSYSAPLATNAPVLVRATVGGDLLRALTVDDSVVVDPVSEAAVRLLEEREIASYGPAQLMLVDDAVRAANRTTSFAGATTESAVQSALQIASQDPAVMAALQPWTPTPNSTRTPTPPTNGTWTPYVAVATATPRGCVGDCDGSGTVSVSELIAGIAGALGSPAAASCPAFLDFSISELLRAVGNSLEGCTSPPHLPELMFTSISGYGRKCMTPNRCLTSCVVNAGDADAGRFDVLFVAAGGTELLSALPGLAAGNGQCVQLCADDIPFRGTATIDPGDAVMEHREGNNQQPYEIATPTPTFSCP